MVLRLVALCSSIAKADVCTPRCSRHHASAKLCLTSLVFLQNANLVADALKAAFPDLEFQGIGEKGKSKSFEITYKTGEDDEGKLLWSGKSKGPPRRLKFPEPADIVDLLRAEME